MSEKKVVYLQSTKPGQETFICCPCRDEPQPLVPLILHDRQGPIIGALVCIFCDKSYPVVNGIVMPAGSNPFDEAT